CPLDGGSVDAVFHATLRLLQNTGHHHHTELVAFPLANPVAVGQGAPVLDDDVRRLLQRQLASERYDGLLVLHDDPAVNDLTFRLNAEEGSLNLATELLSHAGANGKLSPLEKGDLEPRGANEGTATVLHALLPARQGRAACAKLGAEVILDVLAELGAIEDLWRQPA
ncbi:MAG: hypothetical protein JWO82_4364, partial [Akkermansiaceae bacterium]|nr:hypothetical protein [Akkermansiaceae bacterium]